MFYRQIEIKRDLWLKSDECTIKELIAYIVNRGYMRDAQIEAIKTYLFLKIACKNKPLWELFATGFFNTKDISELAVSEVARKKLAENPSLLALLEYALTENGEGVERAPNLKNAILKGDDFGSIDIIKKMFYGVSYSDYLFSLPMGAGKTYLMACFIYLDLYFAQNEPDNKAFAHNFFVFAPSGLKSSVVPSLKTIKKFDPSWIIPEPSASSLKKLVKFEVLDEQRSQNKSNRAKNPNAQKINNYQPIDTLMGLVAVTNAEKVIMDRLKIENGRLFELTDDEKDRQANELRNIISKIPNLAIYIDEVHHAMDEDIKLRGVVNNWTENGTINSVIGFSGTPYLDKPEPIQIGDELKIKNIELANVVNYYPLINGIGNFLKTPEVHISTNNDSLKIVETGVREFLKKYKDTVYSNGYVSKLAIYCGTIERLETQIYPLIADVLAEYGINRNVILKYHKGNKEYKIEEDAQLEFDSLDTSLSKIRIVLLVQIGKEGWDCKSLSGVILSQEGDCPSNMVLQTSCRCLRQVDKGVFESADIWLNTHNAKVLNTQLQKQQHITLEEFNAASYKPTTSLNRHSRMDVLKLPPVDFYQLRLLFHSVDEMPVDVSNDIANVLTDETINQAVIKVQDIKGVIKETRLEDEYGNEPITFNQWLYLIAKESLGTVTIPMLNTQVDALQSIFQKVIHAKNGIQYYSSKYYQELVRSKIRQAFAVKHKVSTTVEPLPENSHLLRIDSLTSPIETTEPQKYFPDIRTVEKVIKADNNEIELDEKTLQTIESLIAIGQQEMARKLRAETGVPDNIDRTYHYLPYKFDSKFEIEFLKEMLQNTDIKNKGLEVYYNGDRGLTDFKIKCYKKDNRNSWKYLGDYTPDFLVVQRKDDKIHKVIIVETKGEGYSHDAKFIDRKHFMEGEFKRLNNSQFGYERFDYLYIEDTMTEPQRLSKIQTAVNNFFN